VNAVDRWPVDVAGDRLRVHVHVVPIEPQGSEAQGGEAAVPGGIPLSRRPAGMPLLAIHLDDDAEVWEGEVDAGDELVAVKHVVLGHGLREPGAPHELAEARLEDAAHRPFSSCFPLENGAHNPTARAKTTSELFPSSPDGGRRKPTTSKPVIEKLLEAVDVEHNAEVQDRSKRTRHRNAVNLGDVPGVETLRLVPDDVASSISPAMP
jgi:hypothetical protein